ncbi:hypothetical protein V0288_12970 [Pannus brasiliensis CCIBt3594]|uniref:Uncharacterized protein n=1 Tax=Pannus brasiliensis CCIBt3594 TaxID=1427578 RepID=A0AAW9QJQ2_9CHRO
MPHEIQFHPRFLQRLLYHCRGKQNFPSRYFSRRKESGGRRQESGGRRQEAGGRIQNKRAKNFRRNYNSMIIAFYLRIITSLAGFRMFET